MEIIINIDNKHAKVFLQEMQGVYSSSIVKETLDESPMAYKDSEVIKSCLGPSVEIIEQLYPILNIRFNLFCNLY